MTSPTKGPCWLPLAVVSPELIVVPGIQAALNKR